MESGELPATIACKFVEDVSDKKEQKEIVKKGGKAVRDRIKKKPKPKKAIVLPEKPAPEHVAEVDAWIQSKDERSDFERFMVVWKSCSDTGKAAIRAWVMDN